MKRLLGLLVCLCVALTAMAGAEEEAVVNLFTWEDYLDGDTIAAFEAETGIQVNFTTFASNEEMMMRLQANGGSEYDCIIASDYAVSTLRKAGLLLPLDKNLLPNWKNLDANYLGQYYDPTDEYAVPYTVGSPMIVYDPSKTDLDITSFADLLDESLQDNISLIDDARVTIGAALCSLGYSYNTTNEQELAEAEELLLNMRKNVRVLAYDGGYAPLLSGEVAVSYMFTPFAMICLMENPNLKAIFAEEARGFGIDSMVIPINAPHPENAHALIDFVLRADVGAAVAEYQLYITPNAAAAELLNPELKAMSPWNIPQTLLERKEFVMDLGQNESLYQTIWERFKLS